MRALKILVVIMAVLLVLGTAGLVVAIISRVERAAPSAAPSARSAEPVPVELPAGARIVSTELSGDRILVRVALAAGGEELLLFDARTGARVVTIDLRPQSPAAK